MLSFNRSNLVGIVILFVLTACGGSDSSNGGGFSESDFDYIVDVSTGDDANPGTIDEPFKTISQALSVVGAGESIHVRGGTYDVASGETFPLLVTTGVTLVGNEGAAGIDTIIDGGGPSPVPSFSTDPYVTVVLNDDSVFAGFSVLNTNPNGNRIGLHLSGDRIGVLNNTITGIVAGGAAIVAYGIVSSAGSEYRFIGNVVDGNDVGINLFRGGDNTLIQDNVVANNNRQGILLQQIGGATGGYVDLGGGTLGSTGGNLISCNSDHDLSIFYNNTIDARNNLWDHAPPVDSDAASPYDIRLYKDSLGTDPDPVYNATGAVLAPMPCL